jgi:Ser/Thr protein kinase RdoA (MazF antagonist)
MDVEASYLPAARKALEHFPIDVDSVTFVDFSENVTFRVQARDSETDYVLRLHRPGYNSLEELESERAWVDALVDAGIPVPDPLVARDDAQFVLIDIPETGEQRYAGMTTWLEGVPLYRCPEVYADPAERPRILHRIGEIAAAMHNQVASWPEPAGFTRPSLDLDGLLGDSPRWGRFWEHDDLPEGGQARLLETRERLKGAIAAYGTTPENFGLIHADLDSDNIIYHDGDLALIDFDDSAYGWHLYDIASALIEYCSDPDFDSLQSAMLAGYQAHRQIDAEDLAMLPAFLLARGLAIVGWYHDRPEYGDSQDFHVVKDWVLGQCETLQLPD